MRQKLQFISRVLLLILLPAFALKPALISVVNGFQNSAVSPVQKSGSFQPFTGNHENLRSVSRENSPIPTLSPCYQKTILASSEGRVFAFVSTSVSCTPQNFLVLRI